MIDTRSGDGQQELKIFIAAGEVSGDRQAAYLARALHSINPNIHFFGSGGDKMREAGVDIRIQTSHLGSVGFQESFRYVSPLRTVLSQLRSMLRNDRPSVAILVDNEGFNGILAKFLYNEQIPFIYYFPPQVWLWGEWRAKSIARRASLILPAFPAEVEIYRREGGNVQWCGHPLLDIVKPDTDFLSAFHNVGLDPARPTIGLMPGSRVQEVEQLAPALIGAAQLIKSRYPEIQFVVPLAAQHLRTKIEQEISRASMSEDISIVTKHVYAVLQHCKAVLLASGTATLEVALLGVPMVVAYRVKPFTFFLGSHLVKTRFIAMPNILLQERVVPELLQDDVTADRIAREAFTIIEDSAYAQRMSNNLQRIRPLLGNEGVLHRAASHILREVAMLQPSEALVA